MRNDAMNGRMPVALLFLVLGTLCLSSCSNYPVKEEELTLGVVPLEQNALIYVAEAKGFFAHNGVRVTIRDYDTGVATINGMLKGEVDIAGAAEFPLVSALFRKEQIDVIACNDRFENAQIIGRRDRGIEKIGDLKGKKIGLAEKTIAEFYLGRFLELHRMSLKDVTLVDVRPTEFVHAITAGSVDAIVAWQPYASRIERESEGIVIWPANSSQPAYAVLVAARERRTQRSSAVERFLKALSQAEEYLLGHSDESRDIVGKRLNLDRSHMAKVWPFHRFSLSLEQTLIVAMKDEAQWMIRNGLTGEKQIPDFLDYIYVDGLKTVKPEAVSITR